MERAKTSRLRSFVADYAPQDDNRVGGAHTRDYCFVAESAPQDDSVIWLWLKHKDGERDGGAILVNGGPWGRNGGALEDSLGRSKDQPLHRRMRRIDHPKTGEAAAEDRPSRRQGG